MESSNSRNWTGRVARLVKELDPRTVRFRDPGVGFRRPALVIVPAVAFLTFCAVAFAASGGASQKERQVDDGVVDPIPAPPSPGLRRAGLPFEEKAELMEAGSNSEPTIGDTLEKRPMNFHDPLYVFCDETAHKVSAYPMADPPGVVVNLDGVPEPEADAKNMVGKDSRIRAVRRRVTSTGIRYVLALDIPIRRIRVIHEGAVVIILPVR